MVWSDLNCLFFYYCEKYPSQYTKKCSVCSFVSINTRKNERVKTYIK